MAKLLLFNIDAPEKNTAIRLTAMRLGIGFREIPPERQGQSLADLLTDSESTIPTPSEPFSDEMLVMDGLDKVQFNGLLDGMRNLDARVGLKAVVTEQNLKWSPAKLHKELLAEREAMSKYMNKK